MPLHVQTKKKQRTKTWRKLLIRIQKRKKKINYKKNSQWYFEPILNIGKLETLNNVKWLRKKPTESVNEGKVSPENNKKSHFSSDISKL